MIKKILATLTIAYMAIVSVLPFAFGGKVDDGAVKYKSDGDFFFFDSEAVALSESSEEDAGLRAVAIEANNLVVSHVRAEECSEKFSHTRPNGKQWYTVNSKIQGGENLAFGFDTAEEAVEAWMNSPTHRDNILYDEFTKVAISIYQEDDGTCYWAQEYGY